MCKSFENKLSNKFQVIAFERMAKNCFKVIYYEKYAEIYALLYKKYIFISKPIFNKELMKLLLNSLYYFLMT